MARTTAYAAAGPHVAQRRASVRVCLGILIGLVPGLVIQAQAGPDPVPLADVANPANLPKYVLRDCTAAVVQTDTGAGLRLEFGHEWPWPNIRFDPAQLGYTTDWQAFAFLAVTVSNPTDASVKVNIRVDSAATADRGRQGGEDVPAGARCRLLMPVGGRPPIIGMSGQPPLPYEGTPGDRQISHTGVPFDSAQITAFQVFLGRPVQDHTLQLHEVALIPSSTSAPLAFVDRFGQFNGADWPGRLHSEAELADRVKAERVYLQTNGPLADRNEYGGWAAGPQLDATGRFRVAKHDGKWWFVDPSGRLFWSSGVTCVRFNVATIVTGREQCFEWLPGEDDSLARFYSGWRARRMFDFFQANAFRKYGEGYSERFHTLAAARLQACGMNTIGCWSSPDSWRLRRVPYTIPVNVPRVPMFVASSYVKAGREKKKWFPDPFDPKFRQGLAKQLVAQAEFKDDPWLLGVFIHNELPWVLGAPWRNPDQPVKGIGLLCLQRNDATLQVKRVLVDQLRDSYEAVAELNRAWGTTFTDWEALLQPFELTPDQIKSAQADLKQLDVLIAEQYFRVCREAMNEHMPGVLYLGCRFSGAYARHIVEVARKSCDVMSFNIYAELPAERTADELAGEMDFPVVIGEFHFGALDRGMFHTGLRKAKDQQERAVKYAAYVRAAAAAPWCVGAHWFQYLDQALTGRPDGENYNIGFVDGTDDPYPEMRAAARRVHADLYRVRAR